MPLAAQDTPRISELTPVDRQYMAAQRESVEDLARRHFGQGFTGARDHDLELLQRLLDQRLVRPTQTEKLQAMGVILGDVLADELDMHWVIYQDRAGRSRALRYKKTDNYLFPVTMISRRQEAGSDTPVTAIYQKAVAAMEPVLEPLPYH
ncbi:dihydrodipicolinate synthase [Kineobactrum sediminis]|uniref:Dihydrodipicolinate synthase n=2 Tax=Kineobactrum sediminis TaxID=1905677 RepID=A0A2N5Y4U6_9GAMM|nr:dihydrodipicolinate synthase [Kineobactrum sediminis]